MPPSFRPMRVLLVFANKNLRETYRGFFLLFQCDVEECADIVTAEEIFKEEQEQGNAFELVFTGLRSMSGHRLFQTIGTSLGTCRFLIMDVVWDGYLLNQCKHPQVTFLQTQEPIESLYTYLEREFPP